MAITILQEPAPFTSAHGPLWHNLSSDNTGNADFRFVFDIYGPGGMLLRAKAYPDTAGQGRMNVTKIVASLLSSYFYPTDAALVIDTNGIYAEYDVEYGEQYRTGGVTVLDAGLAGGSYSAYNSYTLLTPGANPTAPLVGKENLFITDRDLTNVRARRDAPLLLSFFNPDKDDFQYEIQPLNSNGVAQDLTLAFGTAAAQSNTFSPGGVLQVLSLAQDVFDLESGINPGIFAIGTADAFRMRIISPTAAFPATDWVTVTYGCSEGYPVHFLNRYGGFDTVVFEAVGRREIDIQRERYQGPGVFTIDDQVAEYDSTRNLYAEHAITYATSMRQTYRLRSGWLTDDESAWLLQLLASPQVHITDEGIYYPVTVKTDKWRERLALRDKVYDLEVELELSRSTSSQSR